MVLITLRHNNYEDLFVKLCSQYSKDSIAVSSLYATYCFHNCLRGINQERNLEEVEEIIRTSLMIDYKFFFVWLFRCFVELYKGNTKTAKEYFDTARSTFSQSINKQNQHQESSSYEMTQLIRFDPLIKLASGLIYHASGDFQNALAMFKQVALSSVSAIPRIRLAVGMCYEQLDHQEKEAMIIFQGCIRNEAKKIAEAKIKELEEENSSISIDEEKKEENEKLIQEFQRLDKLPVVDILNTLVDNKCKITNLTALLHLAMIDKANIETYIRVAEFSDPNNVSFILYKTQLMYQNGQTNKVIHTLFKDKQNNEGLLQKIPSSNTQLRAECLFQIARAQHKRGKVEPQGLLKLYKQVIEINPDHFAARYAIAHINLTLGNVDEAIATLEPKIDSLLNKYEAHMVLGMCYATKYRRNGSIENANKAKTYLSDANRLINNLIKDNKFTADKILNGEQYKLYTTLGWLYLKTLEYDKAKTSLSDATKLMEKAGLTPDDQTLTFLAISQFQLEEFAESLETYKKVSNQEDPIIRFNVGRCYEATGETEKAVAIYEKLTEDYPSFPESYIRLGVIAMNDTTTEATVNFGKAKEYFQTVKQECGSQSTRAELYLAMVYNKEGDYRSSTNITEKICRQTTDGRLTATVMYANAFLQHGQNKESQADREKNFKSARTFYYSALKTNCYCISAASGLALSWLLFGYVKEARNQLRIVKENQPRLAGPAEALANAYLSSQGTGGSGEFNPAQAAIEFEECNRTHFDRTNTQNFNGAYNAYKLSGKFEECLAMAEYMIQLEPDRPIYWYYLASSIMKYVQRQTSSHSVDIQTIRVKNVDKYINQLKRARELFVLYGQAGSKVENIDTVLFKKLEKLRRKAIENDQERRNRLASSIPESSITEEEHARNK